MSYYINLTGDSLYLLDSTSKKCGVFRDDCFVGFTTWTDKVWSYEVSVIGIMSYGTQTSLITNNKAEIVNMSALDCARTIKKIGGIFKTLIMRGNIDNNKLNGYVFVYNSGSKTAEEVRKLCNF